MTVLGDRDLNNINIEASEEAKRCRAEYQLGTRGIDKLFNFIENTLGYLLFRYPLGEDSIQGFSSIYKSDKLIVTNSSNILSRERFTAAHELAHHLFDLEENKPNLIYDQEIGIFNANNIREYRADCFAANFLMPQHGIESAVWNLRKIPESIDFFDVIKLQSEFGVSYKAMVKRLKELDLIAKKHSEYLYSYYNETSLSLKGLFHRANADISLLEPYNEIQIPVKYMEYVQENYNHSYISYYALENILNLVNETPLNLGFKEKSDQVTEKEPDIDKLLDDLDD